MSSASQKNVRMKVALLSTTAIIAAGMIQLPPRPADAAGTLTCNAGTLSGSAATLGASSTCFITTTQDTKASNAEFNGDFSTFVNSGTITDAKGSTGSAFTATGDSDSVTFLNVGTITLDLDSTFLHFTSGGQNDDLSLINNGSVTLSANDQGSVFGAKVDGDSFLFSQDATGYFSISGAQTKDATMNVIGVHVIGTDAELLNDGTFAVTATGSAKAGTYAFGASITGGDDTLIDNDGSFTVTSTSSKDGFRAFSYGVDFNSSTNSTINNGGTFTVNASTSGKDSDALSVGVDGGVGQSFLDFYNDGTFSMNATTLGDGDADALAYGVISSGSKNGSIDNDGTFVVVATTNGKSSTADAFATGFVFSTGYVNDITNDGTVNITASAYQGGATATGISSQGVAFDFLNSGDFNVTATSTYGSATALGAYVTGYFSDFINTGDFDVTAQALGKGGGATARGLTMIGDNNRFLNYGSFDIYAHGSYASGLYWLGDAGYMLNDESFTVRAQGHNNDSAFARGVRVFGDNNVFKNGGSYYGYGSDGVFYVAADSNNKQNATAVGFIFYGENNTLINYSKGYCGPYSCYAGIYVRADANQGGGRAYATGASFSGDNSTLVNFGSFVTEAYGSSAAGALFSGDNTLFVNKGYFATEAFAYNNGDYATATGVDAHGDDGQFLNFGKFGVQSYADNSSGNATSVGFDVSGDSNEIGNYTLMFTTAETLSNKGAALATGSVSYGDANSFENYGLFVTKGYSGKYQGTAIGAHMYGGDDQSFFNQGTFFTEAVGANATATGFLAAGDYTSFYTGSSYYSYFCFYIGCGMKTVAYGVGANSDASAFGVLSIGSYGSFEVGAYYGIFIPGYYYTSGFVTGAFSGNNGQSFAQGFGVYGDDNTLTNNGLVYTYAYTSGANGVASALGVYFDGSDNSLVNEGVIFTYAYADKGQGTALATGVYSKGYGFSLTNNGYLITLAKGSSAVGVLSVGDSAVIANNGLGFTLALSSGAGDPAYATGLSLIGDDSNFTNSKGSDWVTEAISTSNNAGAEARGANLIGDNNGFYNLNGYVYTFALATSGADATSYGVFNVGAYTDFVNTGFTYYSKGYGTYYRGMVTEAVATGNGGGNALAIGFVDDGYQTAFLNGGDMFTYAYTYANSTNSSATAIGFATYEYGRTDDSTITNSGYMTSVAIANGGGGEAVAGGIAVYGDSNTVTNFYPEYPATVYAYAAGNYGTNGSADAFGIETFGKYNTIDNAGIVYARSYVSGNPNADAQSLGVGMIGSNSLDNTFVIRSAAESYQAGDATAYGVISLGFNEVHNGILVGKGYDTGYIGAFAYVTGAKANNADALAVGVAFLHYKGYVSNTEDSKIYAYASNAGDGGSATAVGVLGFYGLFSAVFNDGLIEAYAAAAGTSNSYAAGVAVSGYFNGIFNTGGIYAAAYALGSGDAEARGISTSGDYNFVANKGYVVSVAYGSQAFGVYMGGDDSTFYNSGLVFAFATSYAKSDDAVAVGFGSYGNYGDFENTGVLFGSAETYGEDSNAYAAGAYITGSYNIFYGSDGATVALALAFGDKSDATAVGFYLVGDCNSYACAYYGGGAVTGFTYAVAYAYDGISSASGIAVRGDYNYVLNVGYSLAYAFNDNSANGYAFGARFEGADNTFVNTGLVYAYSGNYSYGVFSENENFTLINEGVIVGYAYATGSNGENNGFGVYIATKNGSSAYVYNSGYIYGSGTGLAIIGGGSVIENDGGAIVGLGTYDDPVIQLFVDNNQVAYLHNDSKGFIGSHTGSPSDVVIVADGNGNGYVYIQNDATMRGRVYLTAGDDIFNNTSFTSWVVVGENDFGAGDDELNNSGLVLTAVDDGVDELTELLDLEEFNNQGGILSMNDGAEDDTTYTSGDFTGSGNSRLVVDTFLGAPGSTSDIFQIGGLSGGSTAIIVLDTNNGPGAYNPTGIPIVFGSDDPSHFTLSSQSDYYLDGVLQKGLWDYHLVYNPATDVHLLIGEPGQVPAQLVTTSTAVQSLFGELGSLWRDRNADLRRFVNGAHNDKLGRPGGWLTGFGNWGNRQATVQFDHPLNPLSHDVSYDQGMWGIIGGLDLAVSKDANPNQDIRAGIVAGFGHTQQTFKDLGTVVEVGGPTVGAYLSYLNYNFFFDALFRYDMMSMDFKAPYLMNFQGVDGVDARTYGFVVDTGYRFDFDQGRLYFEPLLTAIFASTHIDDFEVMGTTVDTDRNSSFRGGAGARFGGTMMENGHNIVDLNLSGRVWNEFSGDNFVNFYSGGPDLTLVDDFGGTFGGTYYEVGGEVSVLNTETGLTFFLKGVVKFDNTLQSNTIRAGLRGKF